MFRFAFVALIAFAVIAIEAKAQSWDNPADKYLDAHEDYAGAVCPIATDDISHFVYFARDRQRMRGHAFLDHQRFEGAQIMYRWRDLEPSEGKYDFSRIRSDLNYLKARDKGLFIQLQDVTFSAKYKPVPDYLMGDRFDGGIAPTVRPLDGSQNAGILRFRRGSQPF